MRLLFPDYCGLLKGKAPLFQETFRFPTPRFQRKVADTAVLPPAQSYYLNLIGMLLVPAQGCRPDHPFKGATQPPPKSTLCKCQVH